MRIPLGGRILLALLALGCTGPSSDVQNVLRVHEVAVDPGNLTIQIGTTNQLAATARTGSGLLVPNRPVTWTSNAPELASVSPTGLVSALQAGGPVQITATVDGIPGSAVVMVTPEPITRVTVTPPQTTLLMGSTTQLAATATDQSGNVVSGVSYAWVSSDPAIADVTTTGRVFAIAPGGPVTITATTGAISGTAAVTVSPVASRLAFTQQPANGVAGQPLPGPVRVMVQDPNGNPLSSSTAQVSIRLGANSGGATLSGGLTAPAVNGVATFSELKVDRPGSGYTLIASATGLLEATSTVFDIAPISITISIQPSSSAVSGQPFAQQPVIAVSHGIVPLTGVPVTASIVTGGGTLGGNSTATSNQSGLASFTNLSISGAAGSRTLRFDAPGATGVNSTAIQVTTAPPGTPPHLGFLQPPGNGTAGRALNPPVRVVIQDANGGTVTSSSAPVTIALGNNPSSGTLSGTLTVNAVSGIATFSNLVVDRAGNGYTLVASSPGLTGTTSGPFTIAGITLAITIDASANATSGVPFSQQPVILVRDGSNTPAAGVLVTASIASGGGTLGGTMTILSNPNGYASFNDLSISGVSGSRTLQFTTGGAVPVSSGSIMVTSPPSVLAFTQQPPNGVAGRTLAPPIQVAIRDQYGSTVPGSTNPVTVQLGSNPGGAVLSGTLTVSAVNGVATFANLALDKPGTGYTLIVSSVGLTSATSSAFTVSPVTLTITTQPSATATSSQPFAQQPVVTVRDGASQPLAGIPVTVTIASGGGTLSGTATVTSNSSGVASFTNLAISGTAGARTLGFAAAGATPVTSNPIVVSPGPTQLTFTQPPSNGTVGQVLTPAVQVAIQDATGSTVITSSSPVTIQLGSNPGTATLSGTLTVNAVNGVATFNNLALDKAGTGYTLVASSSGLPNRTSAAFNIGAVTLTITTQPSATATSGQAFAQQPVVTVRDGASQPLAGIPVTVAIASGGGTLSGTATVASNSSGVASFTSLAITGTAGSRTLSFAATGATPVISNPIVVSTTPTQLTFTQAPTNGTVGQVLTPPVQVAIQDATGSTVTTSSSPVTIQLGNNPGTATLSGTLTVNAVNGVATFNNLALDKPGTGYTLVASSSGLPNRTSAAFNIGPVTLTITTQPSSSVPNGQAFPQQPAITVRNAANAVLSGVAVTVTIASGGGTLGGTTTVTSNQSGIATFTNLSITGTTGSRTLSFSASGAAPVTSTAIAVTTGPASQLTITIQPSSIAARNTVFPQQPVIQLRDSGGNPVTQSGVSVTAAIASGPGTAVLGGTLTVTTDATGVATFTNLKIDRGGTFTLRFSSGTLQSVVSSSIVIP